MVDIRKQIVEQYIQAYNSFDVPGMLKDVHEEIVFQNITNGTLDMEITGVEAFQKQAETATQYFQSRKQSIMSWDVHDSTVKISISYEGILAIALPNGMKEGDTLRLTGQSVFEFEGKKIIRITDES